ncbi:MAG: glutathione peroxidase [Candidatus Cloacimonadota bacterium]|nr:glutathione peroxidase [Candidatus Cloacimonadota bacterium]
MMFILLVAITIIQAEEQNMNSIYDFEMVDIKGDTLKLSEYTGKVILIVNTASKCGFTYQYEGLEKLFKTYKDQGLVILGFPANNFLKQEPGTDEEIATFCSINYGVTFPMFSKISVRGKEMHPLYKYLTSKETNPEFGGKISWNFNKFLISKEGKIINRFGSKDKPGSDKVIDAIEEAL